MYIPKNYPAVKSLRAQATKKCVIDNYGMSRRLTTAE